MILGRRRRDRQTERSVQESVFANNTAYVATLGTLSAEHFITPKLLVTGRVFGGYGDDFEKAPKVSGGFFAYSIGVEYQIQKWLALSADDTHKGRILGVVMNGVNMKRDGYYCRYSHSYYAPETPERSADSCRPAPSSWHRQVPNFR